MGKLIILVFEFIFFSFEVIQWCFSFFILTFCRFVRSCSESIDKCNLDFIKTWNPSFQHAGSVMQQFSRHFFDSKSFFKTFKVNQTFVIVRQITDMPNYILISYQISNNTIDWNWNSQLAMAKTERSLHLHCEWK